MKSLCDHLKKLGIDLWIDEEKLLPGQDWELEIRKAVRISDIVLVCLSNSSATSSGYVHKEMKFAVDIAEEKPEGTIFIIPCRFDNVEMPEKLIRFQWVNLFEKSGFERLFASLITRARSLGINIET